jgi:hypothetical protein
MSRKSAMLVFLTLTLASPAMGQELGRLFLTPEQRTALDARRKARIPDKPAAVAAESPVTRIDGLVSRGRGKSTVWVNGEPVPEGAQADGLRVLPLQKESNRVTVRIGDNDNRVDLKIGQSFDRETGKVNDDLPGGEIKVSPPSRNK